MNNLLWWATRSLKQGGAWCVIFHLMLVHCKHCEPERNVKVEMHYETTLLSVRALCFSISKGGGWAFALEAVKTCLELLNQQNRRGKQVPLSLSALELKEVFWQLALWIWFPLHQNMSAINKFQHNASTHRSHTLMWPKSFLSMTIMPV